MKQKTIWKRGYDWIDNHGMRVRFNYPESDKRLAALAFEAGWKAAKRDDAKKRWIRI